MEKSLNINPIKVEKTTIINLEKGKLPPQTLELEEAVLGAMMIDKKGVDEVIDIPLIVGGGIKDIETAKGLLVAGADVIVVGNYIEDNIDFIQDMGKMIKEYNFFAQKHD